MYRVVGLDDDDVFTGITSTTANWALKIRHVTRHRPIEKGTSCFTGFVAN